MSNGDVIERLDEQVSAFLDRVRYFNEPITLGRAQMFVMQQWKNNRLRNSVLKLRVAANCPIWDVKLRIFEACSEEIVGDHENAGGRPHWEIIEELGHAVGLTTEQVRNDGLQPSTELCWKSFDAMMSNTHWLEGLICNTAGERSVLPGYGKGEIGEIGTSGVERRRWAEDLGVSDDQLGYFKIHGVADIKHSNIGWEAVARYAKEYNMEDKIVDVCRLNFVIWETYFDGICKAGDKLDAERAAA